MNENIKVGDLVTPISDRCGLWLADAPVDGSYRQKKGMRFVYLRVLERY